MNKDNLLQQKIFEIYLEIDRICRRHNIRYYAIGGTCLGALRHKGFIPWDDDLDIAMPRSDYERFKKIAADELPSNLRILGETDFIHYECLFMKVHDVKTTYIHNRYTDYKDRFSGVYVDIMPLDGIPNNSILRSLYFKAIKILDKLNKNRRFPMKQLQHKGYKKIIGDVIKPVLDLFPVYYFYDLRTYIQKQFDFDKNEYSCYGWSPRCEEVVFKTSDFKDVVYLDFNGHKMPCPSGYDNFLTMMYGDYMQLPPEDKRVPCHPSIVDLEKSYEEYKKIL